MSFLNKNMSCKHVAPLLVFYVCDEVTDQERALVAAHLPSCASCSAQLAEERQIHEAFCSLPQSPDELDSTG